MGWVLLENMVNFGKILNKKVIFVIVLILLAGGFFWWQNKEIKGSPDDYVIKETEEGIFVENKKAGLTMIVPEGWEIKKMEVEEGGVTFYSEGTIIEWKNDQIILPLENGCMMGSEVIYEKMDFEEIKEEARRTHLMLGVESDEFEEILVNNYKTLKNTFELQEYGPGVGIYIPIKNKGYAFYLYWASNQKEECVQEFDKFLETISIQ